MSVQAQEKEKSCVRTKGSILEGWCSQQDWV